MRKKTYVIVKVPLNEEELSEVTGLAVRNNFRAVGLDSRSTVGLPQLFKHALKVYSTQKAGRALVLQREARLIAELVKALGGLDTDEKNLLSQTIYGE